jgi:hypothetical protein
VPDFNELNGSMSGLLTSRNNENEENLSCQSLADDDDSTSDGSSNTLNDSSLDTTPQSSRILHSVENQIVLDKIQPPIDKRLPGGAAFKNTSTPVMKTATKSEIKIDSSDEPTGIDTSPISMAKSISLPFSFSSITDDCQA